VTLFENIKLDCKPNEIPKNVRIEVIDKSSKYFKGIGEIINKSETNN